MATPRDRPWIHHDVREDVPQGRTPRAILLACRLLPDGWRFPDRVESERALYRIVRDADVAEDDFRSAKDLGKPLREPTLARQWAEGVSVYDTLHHATTPPRHHATTPPRHHATAQARKYRYKLGRFVVAVTIPPRSDIEIEQSGSNPHHYTLFGAPREPRELVIDAPWPIEEERRDEGELF